MTPTLLNRSAIALIVVLVHCSVFGDLSRGPSLCLDAVANIAHVESEQNHELGSSLDLHPQSADFHVGARCSFSCAAEQQNPALNARLMRLTQHQNGKNCRSILAWKERVSL